MTPFINLKFLCFKSCKVFYKYIYIYFINNETVSTEQAMVTLYPVRGVDS